jgi:CheY-like chemotaxis protein
MQRTLIILLAEDDANDFEIFSYALQQNGVPVNIQRVHDGEEAIRYLEGQFPFSNRSTYPFPDLIILDLKMPRLTGLEVLQWRRNQPECARLPVIMLSGSGLQQDINYAYHLGVNSYFSKPGSVEKLQQLLRKILDYWSSAELPQIVAQHCW